MRKNSQRLPAKDRAAGIEKRYSENNLTIFARFTETPPVRYQNIPLLQQNFPDIDFLVFQVIDDLPFVRRLFLISPDMKENGILSRIL